MKTINYRMLKGKNACLEHLELFRATFGEGDVELSKKNLKIAQDARLDVSFLAHFLSDVGEAEYNRVRDKAWAEYRRVCNEAGVEYDRVRGVAWAEYGRALSEIKDEYKWLRNAAYDEYERARSAVGAEYERGCNAAYDEYDRVCNEALIEILTRD